MKNPVVEPVWNNVGPGVRPVVEQAAAHVRNLKYKLVQAFIIDLSTVLRPIISSFLYK